MSEVPGLPLPRPFLRPVRNAVTTVGGHVEAGTMGLRDCLSQGPDTVKSRLPIAGAAAPFRWSKGNIRNAFQVTLGPHDLDVDADRPKRRGCTCQPGPAMREGDEDFRTTLPFTFFGDGQRPA